MARFCERPGCSQAAAVGYGFDARRHLVFLDVLQPDGETSIRSGALCEHHAATLTPPLGWWLDDRREDPPQLFRHPYLSTIRAVRPRPHSERPKAPRHTADTTEELPFPVDSGVPASQPDGNEDAGTVMSTEPLPAAELKPLAGGPIGESEIAAAVPWIPVFDRESDLDGLLSAQSPLLARAFGSAPKKV